MDIEEEHRSTRSILRGECRIAEHEPLNHGYILNERELSNYLIYVVAPGVKTRPSTRVKTNVFLGKFKGTSHILIFC